MAHMAAYVDVSCMAHMAAYVARMASCMAGWKSQAIFCAFPNGKGKGWERAGNVCAGVGAGAGVGRTRSGLEPTVATVKRS
eukprot:356468-Chlamydomonas_euryale.AAC.2